MFSLTITIIIITALASFTAFDNHKVQNDLIFWPAVISTRRQYYRFITYGFIHAGYGHLIFNMLTLWFIGQSLEVGALNRQTYDSVFAEKAKIYYAILYFTALIVSTIPDYFKNRDNYGYRALGASGAVSAVVFASIALAPKQKLIFFPFPFGIPGYLFAVLYLLMSTYMARRGGDNIGHGAHITGGIYGLVYTIVVAKLVADFDVFAEFVRAMQR
jgi:membrane associated rhomboid family serine protease